MTPRARPALTPLAVAAALLLSTVVGCAADEPTRRRSSASRSADAPGCELPERHRLFMQELLTLWAETQAAHLHIDEPLPRMVFVSKRCVFEAGFGVRTTFAPLQWRGEGVPVLARPHDGTIALPDGTSVQMGLHSYARSKNLEPPYFVLSLMDLWADHPQAGRLPDAADYILGIGLHELVHTVQLPSLQRALADLGTEEERTISDKAVELELSADKAYVALRRQGVDALWAAVLADDPFEKRRLLKVGLDNARQRRARWFVGARAWLARVSPLFLALEGVGEWVRVVSLLDAADRDVDPAFLAAEPQFSGWAEIRTMDRRAIIEKVREQTSREWVQEEGLALALLAEELVPGWPKPALADPPADLHRLLEGVVGDS